MPCFFAFATDYAEPLRKPAIQDFLGPPSINPVFLRNERDRRGIDPTLFGQKGAYFQQFVRRASPGRKRAGDHRTAVPDRHILGGTTVGENSKSRKPRVRSRSSGRIPSFFRNGKGAISDILSGGADESPYVFFISLSTSARRSDCGSNCLVTLFPHIPDSFPITSSFESLRTRMTHP